MNNLIHNIAIIFLIMGIMLMVHYVSRIDHKCQPQYKLKYVPQDYKLNMNLLPRPTKTFNKMFKRPPIWMEYDKASKSFSEINKGKYTPGRIQYESDTDLNTEILNELKKYNKLTLQQKKQRDDFFTKE